MQARVDHGLRGGPAIDMGLGFHNHPDTPIGSFGFVHGPALAASDRCDIDVSGKSSRTAYPRTAIDLLVAGAMLVAQFQIMLIREVCPTQPAVVTVGAVRGGMTCNIIRVSA